MKTSLTTVTVGAIVALASLHVSRTYVAGAQSLSADSAGLPFEVASVKPNRSGEPRLLSISRGSLPRRARVRFMPCLVSPVAALM